VKKSVYLVRAGILAVIVGSALLACSGSVDETTPGESAESTANTAQQTDSVQGSSATCRAYHSIVTALHCASCASFKSIAASDCSRNGHGHVANFKCYRGGCLADDPPAYGKCSYDCVC
jgi:hypothetical protein